MEEIHTLPLFLSVIGTILVVSEAFVPGAHLIVLGIAFLGAGITGLLFGINSYFYLGGFAIFYGIISFYYYRNLSFFKGEETDRTTDSEKLKGKIGKVTEKVTSDSGEIKLGEGFNPFYKARSISEEEIPVDTKVEVVDPGGGNVLKVKSVNEKDEGKN